MLPTTHLLPRFTFSSRVEATTGREDKIQITIEGWQVVAFTQIAIQEMYRGLGSPPPLQVRGRGVRQDLGLMYGWMFTSPSNNPWGNGKKTLTIRSGTLQIEGSPITNIEPPLFSGKCEWSPVAVEHRVSVKAKLALDINPTRFLRHRYFDVEGPTGIQERAELGTPPFDEATFDGGDNYFPLVSRLWSYFRPGNWLRQVWRYLGKIENEFSAELDRCTLLGGIESISETDRHYSVGYVETYWEWLSEDPLRLVRDLVPLVRSFARRPSRERTYNCEQMELEQDMAILSFEYSPGEIVKIYPKTNHRIRIEVCHRFNGRARRFQFPSQSTESGRGPRSRQHTFDSHEGVLTLLERLRERSAFVVNELLAHFETHGSIPESHFSAYDLIAIITHHLSIPRRARPEEIGSVNTARAIISMLVNNGSLAPGGGSAPVPQGIQRLARFRVLERNSRGRYVVAEPFRHALVTLQANTWSLLTTPSLPPRSRRRTGTEGAQSHT